MSPIQEFLLSLLLVAPFLLLLVFIACLVFVALVGAWNMIFRGTRWETKNLDI